MRGSQGSRYRTETLRRLVFIGMMQDIGLTLDEVSGILDAATAAEWKQIASKLLAALDAQITRLQHDGSRDPVASRRFDELVQAADLRIEPVTQDQARIAREA